jgi:tol-pal system protein YbgF
MTHSGPCRRFTIAMGIAALLPTLGIAQERVGNPPSGNRGIIELLNQIETLELEIKRLRGEIEVQNHTIEQLSKQQRAQYLDLDQRLQAFEGKRGGASPDLGAASSPETTPPNPPPQELVEMPPGEKATSATDIQQGASAVPPETQTLPEETPPPATPQVATAPTMGEEEAYRQAFNQLRGGRYDQSISAFNNFLVQYPHSEHSDNAQYWLGEAYYVKRQFESAIPEYSKLVQNFPQSQKLTHALLKIGYSYQELGQIDKAVASFQSLKTRYPGTMAARLAEERLQQLKLKQP